ncbi:MAG: hypothetical protein AB7V36_08020 [Bacteroidales bacterium]
MKPIIPLLFAILPLIATAQNLSVSPFFTSSKGLLSTTWHSTNDHTFVTIDTSITKYSGESTNISLGAGNRYGVNIEKKYRDLISFGLSLSYFSSKDVPLLCTSKAEYDPYSAYNLSFTTTDIYKNKSFDLGIYSNFIIFNKSTAPYVKTGLIFSFSKYTLDREVYIFNNIPGYYPTERYNYNYKISPSFHYGFTGAAGIETGRNKTISLYAEIYSVFMNVSPTKQICTAKTWNSEDQFETMTTSDKETVFVESYSEDDNKNEDEPTKNLKYNQSFCSIGLQAGVKIHF